MKYFRHTFKGTLLALTALTAFVLCMWTANTDLVSMSDNSDVCCFAEQMETHDIGEIETLSPPYHPAQPYHPISNARQITLSYPPAHPVHRPHYRPPIV